MELVSQPDVQPGSVSKVDNAKVKAQSIFSQWRSMSSDNRSVLQIALLAGIIATIIVVILWTSSQNFVPLYGNQELYDKANILELLEQEETVYKLDASSGQILVPENSLAAVRMALAARGVKVNLPTGMENLNANSGLGTSQFMESMRYRHALEGELARSIITMQSIRSARVHLAIPKRTLFIGRNEEKPTASVMLDLKAGQSLEDGQVEAIVNLVAGSLSGMKPENVTVVDQSGRLLSLSISDASNGARMSMQQADYRKAVEERIRERASDIIYPLVGMDNFRIQVTADLDFNEVEETLENFNPNTVIAKENGQEQTSSDFMALGVPGSLTNQPPVKPALGDEEEAAAAAQDNKTLSKRNQFNREYSVGRSIIHKKYQQGRISQLSVSVILNNKAASGENGWSQTELAQIGASIKNAVGIKEQRGDAFNISGFNFIVAPQVINAPEVKWWQEPVWQEYLRYIVGALLGLALILFGVRPLVKHLISLQSHNSNDEQLNIAHDPIAENSATEAALAHENTVLSEAEIAAEELAAKQKAASKIPDLPAPGSEFSVQLTHLQLLADKETVRVAQVLKNWVNNSERSKR
ncbi:flagellar basal-body MS-ring/collar protein FliF [Thalassotalea sp. PLHSN55]|uniref:flagellar basal-body MS-ring/collar protein FliF n=1 Tax=Thalassotalea sp. PLHSN55 TaxID=3435888 RepID=UPI003F84675B